MKKANMVLAIFTLIFGLVSAFCLATMTYTFVTGTLPFDMEPIMPDVEAHNRKPPEEEHKANKVEELRQDEDYAMSLYKDLEGERERLRRKEKELADRERKLMATERNLQVLLETCRSEAEEIKVSLETIDSRELSNVKEQALLLSEIEPKAGAQLLLAWDEDPAKNKNGRLAPRVLYYMDKKKAGELIASILKENDPEKTRRVSEITDAMRRLTPEVKRD